jgi:hypothetical protein
MGRFTKEVLDKSGIDKRDSGYYSTPEFIREFLSRTMMDMNPDGKYVLDPAVGKEELLKDFFIEGKVIDSFDIIDFGKHEYSKHFFNEDFIEFYKKLKLNLIFDQKINSKYDYIISNPPYNCHEIDYIRTNKNQLKKLFPKVRALNMYSMFLAAMIDIAKEGALIGVIISDSFLTARLHSGLRRKILDECSIHYLILCSNDLFRSQNADVRTSILVLQKGKKYQGKVKTKNRPKSSNELKNILLHKDFEEVDVENLVLSKKEPYNQFIVGVPLEIMALFKYPRIKDRFKCITGISTGNDKKYLSAQQKDGYNIPFYKNPGSRKFLTTPDAYLIDDFMEVQKNVKDFMVRNKTFIGKQGITCSSMGLPFSACYLPKNSTFGVNANIFLPDEDIYWMLSYLNSSLVTYLVRGVLIRSNMVTSGYISQIPVLPLSSREKKILAELSEKVLSGKINANEAINNIDTIVFTNIKASPSLVKMVNHFSENLSKSV